MQAAIDERSEAAGRADAAPHGRARTCVGCGERVDLASGSALDLVRLVFGPGGEVAVDARGGAFGRGAHVHARRACLERAAPRGLSRAAKGKVGMVVTEGGAVALSVEALAGAIREAIDRRIEGLLAAATRSRQVAIGADAVTGAGQRGEAALVVVACDAAAAADLGEVRRAVGEGRAVSWGTKVELAAVVSPGAARAEGVGVVAVLSDRIACALRDAAHVASAASEIARGGGALAAKPRAAGRAPGGRTRRQASEDPAAGGTCAPGGADRESPARARTAPSFANAGQRREGRARGWNRDRGGQPGTPGVASGVRASGGERAARSAGSGLAKDRRRDG